MQPFVIPHKVHGTHRIFYNKKRAHACTRTSAKALLLIFKYFKL